MGYFQASFLPPLIKFSSNFIMANDNVLGPLFQLFSRKILPSGNIENEADIWVLLLFANFTVAYFLYRKENNFA
jgi:hypothetical protein